MSAYHSLTKHYMLIFSWGIFFSIFFIGLSMIIPKQYRADSQVLIISQDRTGIDPYTQAKSAERIGENLAQIMKTTDFYGKVMDNTSYSFNKDAWKKISDRAQRRKWKKDVIASMVYGTGLMNVSVYGNSSAEAANLSNAVTQTIVSRGWEYLGGNVALKAVSTPLVSRWPARPNYIINGLIGFIVGIFLSGSWVVKYKKHIFIS